MGSEKKGLDPAAAYAAVPRSDLLDRLVTPGWYHPVVGAVLALLVAAWATRSFPVVVGALVLWFVAAAALPRLYRRATGVWYAGPAPAGAAREGRRLSLTVAGGLLIGVVSTAGPLWPLALVGAVACFALTRRFGERFDAALRDALETDPALTAHLVER